MTEQRKDSLARTIALPTRIRRIVVIVLAMHCFSVVGCIHAHFVASKYCSFVMQQHPSMTMLLPDRLAFFGNRLLGFACIGAPSVVCLSTIRFKSPWEIDLHTMVTVMFMEALFVVCLIPGLVGSLCFQNTVWSTPELMRLNADLPLIPAILIPLIVIECAVVFRIWEWHRIDRSSGKQADRGPVPSRR